MEFSELQQIVESNSRSIQALADRIAELTLTQEEAKAEREELRQATLRIAKASAFLSPCVGKHLAANLTEGLANLVVSLDDDRPTILGRLSRIENKIDRLIGESDR